MNISIITSIKAPYRTKQIDEICKQNKDNNIKVYYTDDGNEGRDWEVSSEGKFEEFYLKKIKFSRKYGNINLGLIKIIKSSDLIVIGGYEKPAYILLSVMCRLYKKKYIIIFDGISVGKIGRIEQRRKFILKNYVIKNSSAIFANGTVSYKYFVDKFNYPEERIYNQYLTIDGEKIKSMATNRGKYRKVIREKYQIDNESTIIQYSGRLINIKNVSIIIKAINKLENKKIVLLITGDGIERENLIDLSNKLNVKIIITGFINSQNQLFKHYYASDILVLPSVIEPWGLVVNEAMYAKLPVIVSEECGCSLDLVKNNGYVFNPYDEEDLCLKIKLLLNGEEIKNKGENSYKIIKKWSFENSARNFNRMISDIYRLNK